MKLFANLRSRSGLAVAAMGAGVAAGASALGHAPRASECDARDSCDAHDCILASIVMFRHGARTV
jgi:hypothetical protein